MTETRLCLPVCKELEVRHANVYKDSQTVLTVSNAHFNRLEHETKPLNTILEFLCHN